MLRPKTAWRPLRIQHPYRVSSIPRLRVRGDEQAVAIRILSTVFAKAGREIQEFEAFVARLKTSLTNGRG